MPKADTSPHAAGSSSTSTSISYGRRAKAAIYLENIRRAKAGLPQTLESAQHVDQSSVTPAQGPSSSSLPTPPSSSPPPSQLQEYPRNPQSISPPVIDGPSTALLVARAHLAGCWVFLGLPHGAERPPWMRDPQDLYPDSQYVNSWQSLLHVCGWTAQTPPTLAPSSGVQRGGVILLDLEARDSDWSFVATRVMSAIQACQRQHHTRFDVRVFDIGLLGNGAVESTGGDLTSWLRHVLSVTS